LEKTKSKLKSRRTSQRRAKRYKKLTHLTHKRYLKQNQYHTAQRCIRNYGFCANPMLTLQKNFNNTIQNGTNHPPSQPTNLTFHNLCKNIRIPTDTKYLLGLNLKYCLASSHVPDNIKTTVQKMAYAIRTSFHLQKLNTEDSSEYIKQLYIKNKNWHPEPAPLLIEDKITQFEKQLKARHKHLTATLNKRNLRNLTYSQSATLRLLKTDKI